MQLYSISGSVSEQYGVPVPNANVLLKTVDGDRIVQFKPTDQQGKFSMLLPAGFRLDHHYLEVNHLSYELQRIPLQTGENTYHFHLQQRVNLIPEIRVGRRPRIEQEGDTLTYDVGSFTAQTDRSIGDALRRMPGIHVAENGRISYQGQPISAFYIDGDNLLEGKYGVGTRAIPAGMVLSVQVLKNHQPIKVLKDLVISRDVAVNLVIKDDAKLNMSGEAQLGGGLPEQYFTEISTILFNDKHKLLNVLKGNNTGIDLFQDQEDLLIGMETASEHNLLSTGTVGDPQLPRERYYLNNSGGIFTNNLFNLGNQWQLASNADFIIDRNRMDYFNRSAIFTATDSVMFDERLHRVATPLKLEAKLRGERNTDNSYFSNALQMTFGNRKVNASLSGVGQDLAQSLTQDIWTVDNSLQYIPKLRNRDVMQITWQVQGKKLPESLAIDPSSAVQHVDTSGVYNHLVQGATIQTIRSNATATYNLEPTGAFIQRYQVNSIQEWQSLRSSIGLFDGLNNGNRIQGNQLQWRKTYLSATGVYTWKKNRVELSLTLPLAYQYIHYHDPGFSMDETNADWLFSPTAYGRTQLGRRSSLLVRYRFNNRFSDLNSIYQGAILTNYRTLSANGHLLQHQRIHQAGSEFETENPISMLFFNVSYDYSHVASNTISSLEVDERVSRMVLVPLANTAGNHRVSAELSKFVFFLGGKSAIRADWDMARQNQIINGELLPFQNQSLTVRPDLHLQLFRKVQLLYTTHLTWYKNVPQSPGIGFSQRLFMTSQTARLTYSPKPHWHLSIRGQHLHTQQAQRATLNYFFADANMRYKVVHWRTEFEFDLTNIANVQTFEYSMLINNTAMHSQYDIRGRMAILKAIFAF